MDQWVLQKRRLTHPQEVRPKPWRHSILESRALSWSKQVLVLILEGGPEVPYWTRCLWRGATPRKGPPENIGKMSQRKNPKVLPLLGLDRIVRRREEWKKVKVVFPRGWTQLLRDQIVHPKHVCPRRKGRSCQPTAAPQKRQAIVKSVKERWATSCRRIWHPWLSSLRLQVHHHLRRHLHRRPCRTQ